ISQSSDMERDLIEQATLLDTREKYIAWEQRCDKFIESLEEQSRIKRPRLSIGSRQSVIACIARLESLKDSVRGRFVYVGAGYGLRWREIETAFESRILTTAVINSNHIEPRRFLEDASEIVLERVQCIMRRYDSIKINTVFNGEFVAGDKRANKSIATRNYEIYRCTDQREWYVSRVVEPILASLEEFQERDPIRLVDRKRNKHVNLLYVEDDIEGHFTLINNLSRLVRSQISKKKNRKYFCDSVDCGKLNDCAIRLPSEDDKWLKFKNHCRKERVPFVVYADLECALEKTDKEPTSSTYTYQHHVFSIWYYVYCSYDSSLSGYRFHRDNNCISWLADKLKNLAHSVPSVISTNVPMNFTQDDWRKFNSATHCHVCEKPFAKDDKRARDHCHLTGRYRGPGHTNCNLNYKDSRCIPVVFHNLTGYDAHFIIKEIATAYKGRVDLLPITKEKYISFTKHVDDTIDDYIDCSEKLNESCLPPCESFYSSLTLKHTGVKFELLTDIDMVMFVERGIRGGLSQCSNRYARANNKYMPSYDPSKQLSYLMYYNVNNLYGWAMCQPLPYADFRSIDDVQNFDFSTIALDSPTGYILEVDLEYSQHLHDAADNILAEKAQKRITARDSSLKERAAATAVWATMKAKTKMGMGLKRPRKRKRILLIAKRGGILPVLPLLGVLGSLVGGAAGVAKAVNDSRAAKRQLEKMQRHNRVMEGHGVYLAPYKRGRGVVKRKKTMRR
ncbi:hypothetical protein ALC62_14060, partial [Cyphomyrmex costatus]